MTAIYNVIEAKKKEENLPKYYCDTCTKCVNSRCLFYNRRVEPKYNKCFNHSNYHPVVTQYQSPCNIAEITEQNQEKELCA